MSSLTGVSVSFRSLTRGGNSETQELYKKGAVTALELLYPTPCLPALKKPASCLLALISQYLTSKPGTLSLLAWHLKEETDVENRINTRLLQSIIAEFDSNSPPGLLQPVRTALLKTLATDRNKTVNELATEVLADLTTIYAEH